MKPPDSAPHLASGSPLPASGERGRGEGCTVSGGVAPGYLYHAPAGLSPRSMLQLNPFHCVLKQLLRSNMQRLALILICSASWFAAAFAGQSAGSQTQSPAEFRPSPPVPRRLVVGPRLMQPRYTNIFLRKNDGSLWAFGHELYVDAVKADKYGYLKNIEIDKQWKLIRHDAYCLSTLSNNYFVLSGDGSLWTYGINYFHYLGNGQVVMSLNSFPTRILEKVTTANIGANGTAVTQDGTLWIWGHGGPLFTMLGNPQKLRLVPERLMEGVVDAKQSDRLLMVLKTDGSLWVWGEGNCGDGDFNGVREQPIKLMNQVKAIEASRRICCVIKSDDTLWVWQAQPSLPSLPGLSRPKKVLSDVRMASPGDDFIVALKTDGSVWSYGDNTSGQCGLGSKTPQNLASPRKILDGAAEVSASSYTAFALMNNGQVYGWGLNEHNRGRQDDYNWLNTRISPIWKPTYAGFGTE